MSSPDAIASELRAVVHRTGDLPVPGRGATPTRHDRLLELARCHPVSLARLAEAHFDTIAICAELGADPVPGALYGVWASASPGRELRVDPDTATVSGAKAFCSGLGVVDRALVTAEGPGDLQWLVDVDLRGRGVTAHAQAWATPALADTFTGSVELDVPAAVVLAGPGCYLSRPGFWHGACGPAACWAGGAIGLVDGAERIADDDPHRRAHLGALRAAEWELRAVLREAGRQIDACPDDVPAAERRARSVRHLVERAATEVIDRFGAAFGPRPFTSDPGVAQRALDLHLYLRQDHAERDLADLGR